jgi:hypothetical protein
LHVKRRGPRPALWVGSLALVAAALTPTLPAGAAQMASSQSGFIITQPSTSTMLVTTQVDAAPSASSHTLHVDAQQAPGVVFLGAVVPTPVKVVLTVLCLKEADGCLYIDGAPHRGSLLLAGKTPATVGEDGIWRVTFWARASWQNTQGVDRGWLIGHIGAWMVSISPGANSSLCVSGTYKLMKLDTCARPVPQYIWDLGSGAGATTPDYYLWALEYVAMPGGNIGATSIVGVYPLVLAVLPSKKPGQQRVAVRDFRKVKSTASSWNLPQG